MVLSCQEDKRMGHIFGLALVEEKLTIIHINGKSAVQKAFDLKIVKFSLLRTLSCLEPF